MADITVQSGSKIRAFPRPPSSFDPLTAAAAELEHYGFPPRRAERCAVELYRRVWGRIKDRCQYIEPTFSTDRSRPPLPRTPTFSPNNVNWSGGVVVAPAGQVFLRDPGRMGRAGCISSAANPRVLDRQLDRPRRLYRRGANNVLQAGVGQDVYYQSGSIHRDIFPWYEWYPDNMVKIGGVPVSPGDFVVVIISTAMPPGQRFDECDGGIRQYDKSEPRSRFRFRRRRGVQLVGNSAEWIVECLSPSW